MKLGSMEPSSDYSEIISEGMIETPVGWMKIQTTVLPYKETEKAYYAFMRVDEMVDGEPEMLYGSSIDEWIPKSMTENVWWICTKKFDETRKVSNKIFEQKQNNQQSTKYDPFEEQQNYGDF